LSHILRGKFCGAATVGERGQIVIPAEARKEYGLEIGDKVMVFLGHHGNSLVILKASQVTRMLSETIEQLGRIMEESAKEPSGKSDRQPSGESTKQPTRKPSA
jgi:AbrB family looped-hinge helix DNA binding protein